MWLGIQLYKVIFEYFKTHKFNYKRILGAGGMPSSHSAVVACIATMTGKNCGIDSPVFAIATIYALVVMYDAAGVRREAGKQAKVLNEIVENQEMKNNMQMQEKLVEMLGHTPIQVMVGALIGFAVGIFF